MEIFEIHITGSKDINEQLDRLGIKNIIIDLLKPNKEVLRTEYMSSFISNHNNFDECKEYVDNLLTKLSCEIIRVKIESPFYRHYIDKSLYMECHFEPKNDNHFPVSRNTKSGKLMATNRCYEKEKYGLFRIVNYLNGELELCLYDTFVEEDKDWFDLYQK